MVRQCAGWMILWSVLLVCGCPSENYPDVLPATMRQVNVILNNSSLTVQDKRAQLTDLGLSSTTIDTLLQAEELGNQGGGDLRTAYEKVTGSRFTELTPDEVQIYANGASAVSTTDSLDVSYNDEEAQAVVDFFKANNIRSEAALAAYLADTTLTVPSTIPSGTLQALFVDFDPALLLPSLP